MSQLGTHPIGSSERQRQHWLDIFALYLIEVSGFQVRSAGLDRRVRHQRRSAGLTVCDDAAGVTAHVLACRAQ